MIQGPLFNAIWRWSAEALAEIASWLSWLGLRQHGVHDLAAELRASMLGLVRRSGFRECFQPSGGQGYGASGFAWTAALVIDVLHRDPARSRQPAARAR